MSFVCDGDRLGAGANWLMTARQHLTISRRDGGTATLLIKQLDFTHIKEQLNGSLSSHSDGNVMNGGR